MSIRQYRTELASVMVPWYSMELDLMPYFNIPEGFTVTLKKSSIHITGNGKSISYDRLTKTLGNIKTDFSLESAGGYDHCLVDIIEKADHQHIYIYTNDNVAVIDGIATVFDQIESNKAEYKAALNLLNATGDALEFWEAFFRFTRLTDESDRNYMKRIFITAIAPKVNNVVISRLLSSLFSDGESVIEINNSILRDKSFDYMIDVWAKIDVSEINLLDQSLELMIAAGVWFQTYLEIFEAGYGGCYGLEYGDS